MHTVSTYSETLKYLYSCLPMYQRIGAAAYKADLSNTLALSQVCGQPEKKFPSVHIAGTNGKGSVSHMIASVLQSSGYKTGLYTSPHLIDFRERIKVNGAMIGKRRVTDFVERYRKEFEKIRPSFFEMTFALAMEEFARQNIDIAVVETGMGGRLDSTNIVQPVLSIITNIGLDHTRFLGDTLAKIATEKAGIIRTGVPVIIGRKQTETAAVFETTSLKFQTGLHYAGTTHLITNFVSNNGYEGGSIYSMDIVGGTAVEDARCGLGGEYQSENIPVVFAACEALVKSGYKIPMQNILNGIEGVVKNTGLRGRWEILNLKPLAVCDTGHNPDGIARVVRQIEKLGKDQNHMVLGMVDDKDADSVLALLPRDAIYYFCRPVIPRGMDTAILAQHAKRHSLSGSVFPAVRDAYAAAMSGAGPNDLVFVGGSTFVVAEIIPDRPLGV